MSGRRRIAAPTRTSGSPGTTGGGFLEAAWFLPFGIFVIAAAVRLAVLSTLWNLPLVRTPRLDSAEYFSWAMRLASGDATWPAIAQHGPGYPFFLALLLAAGDGSIKFALVVQAMIGGLTAAAVAVVARRLYRDRAGWLAGGVYASYGPVVLVETSLLAEGLLLVLLTTALLCLTVAGARNFSSALNGSRGFSSTLDGARGFSRAAMAGLALGAAIVVRPTALFLAAGCATWLLARGLTGDPDRRSAAFRQVATLLLACAVVVSPVLVKSWSTTGVFSIQGYGGLNFYIGNSPLHDGRATFRLGSGWDALNSEAPRAGLSDPVAQDRYYASKALTEIARYPGRFARLLAQKSLWLVQAEEVRDSHAYYFFVSESPVLRSLPGFGVVFPLACAGAVGIAVRVRRRQTASEGTLLLALYTVAGVASILLLVVGFRYRMVLVPVIAVAAGAGVGAIVDAVSARRFAELGAYLGSGLLAIIVSQMLHDDRNANVAEEWAFTGSALITEHRLTDAEAAYRRALALDPKLGLAWDGLGLTFYDAGRLADARPAFERALEIDPDNSRAIFHLALVHERNGELEAAAAGYARALSLSPFDAEVTRDLGDVTRKLAVRLGMAGRTADARKAMQRAVELVPDNGEAWIDLSLLSLDLGDREGARLALQRGRERGASAERVAFAADALAR